MRLWLSTLLLFLALASNAFAALDAPREVERLAYIDPGAGSFIVQAIVAALAGIAVTLRIYWHKVKGFLGLRSSGEEEEADD